MLDAGDQLFHSDVADLSHRSSATISSYVQSCELLGLTPGCRNSGEHSQRLGRITKAGSNIARWLLAQVTHPVLRKDARLREWYKRIRRRRGSTIARVVVMRKLATVIWQMLCRKQTWAECRAIALAS